MDYTYDFVKPNHYGLIKPDQAKFVFEQSEKHLKDQIDTSQQIATKTTTLLTVVSGLLIGLVGFGITRWSTGRFDDLIATTIGCAIYLYVTIYILLNNIKPYQYKSVGLHPRRIFDDSMFNLANEDYRIEALYINEIIECQKRIDFNKDVNDARWGRFKKALRLVVLSPAVFLAIYGIIKLFSPA
jgi:hypothetical protein